MKQKEFEENNNNNTKTTEKIKRLITYIGLFSTGVIVGILLSKCPKEELDLDEVKEKKAYKYEDEPVIYSWRVVSGEIKGNPKPYKPPQDYEEILRRQKKYKKE
jgi:hypothetical protein